MNNNELKKLLFTAELKLMHDFASTKPKNAPRKKGDQLFSNGWQTANVSLDIKYIYVELKNYHEIIWYL